MRGNKNKIIVKHNYKWTTYSWLMMVHTLLPRLHCCRHGFQNINPSKYNINIHVFAYVVKNGWLKCVSLNKYWNKEKNKTLISDDSKIYYLILTFCTSYQTDYNEVDKINELR